MEVTGEQDNLSPAPCISISNQEAARQVQLFLLKTRKEKKTTRREAGPRILEAQEMGEAQQLLHMDRASAQSQKQT